MHFGCSNFQSLYAPTHHDVFLHLFCFGSSSIFSLHFCGVYLMYHIKKRDVSCFTNSDMSCFTLRGPFFLSWFQKCAFALQMNVVMAINFSLSEMKCVNVCLRFTEVQQNVQFWGEAIQQRIVSSSALHRRKVCYICQHAIHFYLNSGGKS